MPYHLSGKHILVTGATGFIGRHVIDHLHKAGAFIKAFVRDVERAQILPKERVRIFQGDLTDHTCLCHAVEDCQVVFHIGGALTDFKPRSYYERVNVEATDVLAQAAIRVGVDRFIHISTVSVYGLTTGGKINELAPHILSGDAYTDTKVEAEQVIRKRIEEGLPAVIIQPAQVYGPEDTRWTLRPLRLINEGRLLLVDGGKGIIQPIYIDDVAEGIVTAAENGQTGEAYIIGGRDMVTVHRFFTYYAQMLNKKRLLSIPRWLALPGTTLLELVARFLRRPPVFTRQEARNTMQIAAYDINKATRYLGFTPRVDIQEGMQLIKAWLRDNPL